VCVYKPWLNLDTNKGIAFSIYKRFPRLSSPSGVTRELPGRQTDRR